MSEPRSEHYEKHLSGEELARAVGVSDATLARLVRAGLVDSEPGGGFSAATVLRLRRMLRLHDDLAVDLFGAAIIVDLVERLDSRSRDA